MSQLQNSDKISEDSLDENVERCQKKLKLSNIEQEVAQDGAEQAIIHSQVHLSLENSINNVNPEEILTTTGKELASDEPMSKNKRKKLLKLQQWEIKKIEKRQKEREKLRKKRQEARDMGIPLNSGPTRKSLKHLKMSDSACSITVAIDLSFDDLMIDKDIAKVVKQLLRVYTLNRRAVNPIHLAFTSLKNGGKMHAAISKHDGYKNWDVRIEEKPFQDLFPHSNICYLTSESDNILTALEPNTVYIIGGLVDHNAHKGLCFKTAKAMNLKHAQLPLEQLLKMKTRRVLTIDHVFEILLRVTEGKSWTESFLQVIPMRKGASVVEPTTTKQIETIQEESVNDLQLL